MWWTHWREFSFERRDLAQRKISSDLNSFPDTKTCHHRHPFSFCERRITSAEKKKLLLQFRLRFNDRQRRRRHRRRNRGGGGRRHKKSPFQPQSVRKQLTHSRILLRSRKEAKRREVFLLRRRAIGVFSAKVFFCDKGGEKASSDPFQKERERVGGSALKGKGAFLTHSREKKKLLFFCARVFGKRAYITFLNGMHFSFSRTEKSDTRRRSMKNKTLMSEDSSSSLAWASSSVSSSDSSEDSGGGGLVMSRRSQTRTPIGARTTAHRWEWFTVSQIWHTFVKKLLVFCSGKTTDSFKYFFKVPGEEHWRRWC